MCCNLHQGKLGGILSGHAARLRGATEPIAGKNHAYKNHDEAEPLDVRFWINKCRLQRKDRLRQSPRKVKIQESVASLNNSADCCSHVINRSSSYYQEMPFYKANGENFNIWREKNRYSAPWDIYKVTQNFLTSCCFRDRKYSTISSEKSYIKNRTAMTWQCKEHRYTRDHNYYLLSNNSVEQGTMSHALGMCTATTSGGASAHVHSVAVLNWVNHTYRTLSMDCHTQIRTYLKNNTPDLATRILVSKFPTDRDSDNCPDLLTRSSSNRELQTLHHRHLS